MSTLQRVSEPPVIVPEGDPGPRILLSEWADGCAPPALLGSRDLDRSPCPVCGHPTMDCTTHPTQEG